MATVAMTTTVAATMQDDQNSQTQADLRHQKPPAVEGRCLHLTMAVTIPTVPSFQSGVGADDRLPVVVRLWSVAFLAVAPEESSLLAVATPTLVPVKTAAGDRPAAREVDRPAAAVVGVRRASTHM